MRTPKLDASAFYGLPGEIVRALAPETEAHPAALLLGYLSMFGNAVGAGPHVRIGGDLHAARLNVVVVGTTSRARKGTAASLIRDVMTRADPGWEARFVGGFGSGEALIDAVRDPTEEDPGPGDHRLMVREPELARILHVVERDGSTLSQVVREAWDGSRLAVRSRKSTVTATGAHVSVLADITLEELRRALSTTQIVNGFGNRYLYALVHRARKLPSGGHLDDGILAFCADRTARSLDQARHIGSMERNAPAEVVWAEIYNAIPDDETGLFGAIVARAEAQLLRLSITYALSDGSPTIDTPHLHAAAAVWDYCRASALAIFGEATGSPVADRLYEALVDAGEKGLDGEEQLAVFARHVPKDKLAAARTLLGAKGLATTVKQPTDGRPKVHTFIAQEAQEAQEVRLLDLPALSSLPAQGVGVVA